MLHGGVEGIKFAAGIDINIVWDYIPHLDNITFLRIFVLKMNNPENELEKCCPRTYLAFLYPLKCRKSWKFWQFWPQHSCELFLVKLIPEQGTCDNCLDNLAPFGGETIVACLMTSKVVSKLLFDYEGRIFFEASQS